MKKHFKIVIDFLLNTSYDIKVAETRQQQHEP